MINSNSAEQPNANNYFDIAQFEDLLLRLKNSKEQQLRQNFKSKEEQA